MSGRLYSLVLGVSSGLGAATARSLAASGHGVFGVHFDVGDAVDAALALEKEIAELSGFARFFNANAAAGSTISQVTDAVAATLGAGERLTAVVHSLSFGALLPFVTTNGGEAIDQKRMDMTLSVMAHSLVYWSQALAKAELLGAGSQIIAFTSAGSTRVAVGYGAVSAAKAALEAHVRQLAVELAPLGVGVNAVRAGVTITPSFARIPNSTGIAEHARKNNPHRRLTAPADVAAAVCLLATGRMSWVTGNVIGTDGGEILTC